MEYDIFFFPPHNPEKVDMNEKWMNFSILAAPSQDYIYAELCRTTSIYNEVTSSSVAQNCPQQWLQTDQQPGGKQG